MKSFFRIATSHSSESFCFIHAVIKMHATLKWVLLFIYLSIYLFIYSWNNLCLSLLVKWLPRRASIYYRVLCFIHVLVGCAFVVYQQVLIFSEHNSKSDSSWSTCYFKYFSITEKYDILRLLNYSNNSLSKMYSEEISCGRLFPLLTYS